MNEARATARRLLIAVLPLMAASICNAAGPSFSTGIQTGSIRNASVKEASGIVASRMNANVLWSHNDSGSPAQIFPMTTSGTNLGTYSITGASNIDWEDIATGPGPVAGTQYLYIGDIGDNRAKRKNIAVYRLPEPVVSDTQSPISSSISGAAKLTFKYPHGAHNAESMFVDPLTNDIYFITKNDKSKHLYRAAYPQSTSGTNKLELMTTFTNPDRLTAADISPDGNEILIRATGATSGRMYVRPAGGTIAAAFKSTPITIPLHSESQGEAIGFDPTGRGYFTTSEGKNQPIYYYERMSAPAGTMYWDNDGVAAGTYLATGAGIGGSGTWNTSAMNWYNDSAEIPWVAGDNAVFWGAAGTVTLAAGQTVNSLTFKSSGYNLTGSTLNLAGSSVTVDPSMTATIGSVVAGTANLVKNGSGTLSLTRSNTYSGGTTVAGGTLAVMNTTGSGTGTGAVIVNSGGTLGGTGTIAGAVTATSGAHIAPGASIESLDVGWLTLATGSILDFELDTVLGVDTSDLINVAAANGLTINGGMLNLTTTGSMTDGSYMLIDYTGTLNGNVTNIALGSRPAGFSYSLVNNISNTSIDLLVTRNGDFNGVGTVDATNFVVWRKTDGTPAGFSNWRAHFGQLAGSGAGAAQASLSPALVPEPKSALLLVLGAAAGISRGRRIASRVPSTHQRVGYFLYPADLTWAAKCLTAHPWLAEKSSPGAVDTRRSFPAWEMFRETNPRRSAVDC